MMLQQSDHNLPTNVHPRMLSVVIVAGLFAEVVAVIIYHPFPYHARRNDANLIFHSSIHHPIHFALLLLLATRYVLL